MTAPLRSFLFVPGDDEKKLARSSNSGADALIIDLEDSVSESRKAIAREMTAAHVRAGAQQKDGPSCWVRINPLTTDLALHDLAAVMRFGPAGIVVPKIDGPADLIAVSHQLDVLEVAFGLPSGSTLILPVVTETPIAALRLAELGQMTNVPRVYGFTWGAEDLSATVGASTNTGPDRTWATTYQMVRSQTLLAAAGAGVHAVETLHVDIDDTSGLFDSTRAARAEGFTGRIAIHPRQVGPINDALTPSESELEHARRVITAFADSDTGVATLDGKMLDAPHLRQARHVLSVGRR